MSDKAGETTSARVTRILHEHLGVAEAEIIPGATIADDLGADSLDLLEILMQIEQEFNVDISDERAEKVRTVADVVAMVDEVLAE